MQIFHRLRRLAAVLLLVPLCAGIQPGVAAQRTQTANIVNVVAFSAPPADLATPPKNVRGDMLLASDGNIYFTSSTGGNGYGTVSRLAPDGTISVVYAFTDGHDGYSPFAGVIQGTDGNLYGTTYYGGTNNQGSVFKLTLDGQFTQLHEFTTDSNDPKDPYAGLVQAPDGMLYGTTRLGGGKSDKGAIFRLAIDGTGYEVLHRFNGGDGQDPQGRLAVGPDGQLYGTTMLGGSDNRGVIFRLSTAGDYTVLYSFPKLGDFLGGIATNAVGANPRSGLLLAADGAFYGTAYQGGTYGNGTLYRATINGDSLQLDVVHQFQGWGFDAGFPLATPVQGPDGSFYGTSEKGGYTNFGAAWKVAPDGTATMLHAFSGSVTDGESPYGSLLFANGTLYAATDIDEIGSAGSISKLELDVGGVLPIDIEISAAQIQLNDSVTITWNAPDAVTCDKFGSWDEPADTSDPAHVTPISGSQTVIPAAGTYSYGLSCTDAAGVVHNGYAGLIVNAPPQSPVDGGSIVGGGALSWLLLAMLAALLIMKLIKETRRSCP